MLCSVLQALSPSSLHTQSWAQILWKVINYITIIIKIVINYIWITFIYFSLLLKDVIELLLLTDIKSELLQI